jgi:Archaeal holliday junction resolvase (hjc)
MSKAKGTRNEHKAMRILEAAGYHVTRAAGSLGMFDVVAINSQGMRLIQVKTNRDASPVERETIALFNGLPANATKEVWIFRDYAREPLIKTISSRE